MSPFGLHNELKRIGATLNRWQAELQGLLWMSAVLTGLWLLAFTDLFLRYNHIGRFISCGILVGLLGVGLWQVIAALSKKRSIQGVAACVERAFPTLDNHLINVIQFASHGPGNPMEAAYVEQGIANWHAVNISAMRNRRELLRGGLLLSIAVLLLITPGAWTGATWSNALARIMNPFSPRPPVTLATIERVTPGDATVLIGDPVILSCEVSGKKGQKVFLNLWPADDKKRVMQLGQLAGAGQETFSFRFPKATTAFQYRFHAGDVVSKRYAIRALVPLAFDRLGVTIAPPAYTRLETRSFDGLFDTVPVPQGSVMTAVLQCNRKLLSASLIPTNAEPVLMTSEDNGKTWKGQLALTTRTPLLVSAVDSNNTKSAAMLKYELFPDKPPTIRIAAPTARTVLVPGAAPRIQFEIADDFGIASVRLEKINSDERHQAQPVVMNEWTVPTQAREFATNWTGDTALFNTKEPLVFRVVAVDNCTVGEPNSARSSPIIFDWNSANEILSKTKVTIDQAAASLNRLVELQKSNLKKTAVLNTAPAATNAAQWQAAAKAQTVILNLAGRLITNPRKPLGALTESVRMLYRGAMRQVIDVLERIPQVEPGKKPALSQRALTLETRILRILTRADDGIDKVQRHREVTGLMVLLDALVKGQETTLTKTKAGVAKPDLLGTALVQKQDRLATDTGTFVQSCRSESQTQSANDKAFSDLLARIADGVANKKVSANMLRAAEQLQNKAPAQAMPLQTKALTVLKEFQKLLNDWRVENTEKTMAEFRNALQTASKKIDKLAKIEAKVLDAVREIKRQKNKDNKETDALEELAEELNAIDKNTEDSLLKIATDLQIFPELPVGNDLVEDVFQVYEDFKQTAGSEKTLATELGLQKEDFYLDKIEAMKDTKERMDEMEMWLESTPDAKKRNTENFDLQEMPKYPIIPMASEMEDIIGELLEQEEEIGKEADDSATNQGTADMEAGWGIREGETVNYSAKGKSGNEAPDHKEQDGRSNIGRQGMSDGETAAASGKINAGDDQIEKRMTQDTSQSGQVQEDGHAEAKATGGGKQSGYGDELGMAGSGPRRDSKITQGSELGLQAMLRRNAQAIYARAQLSHVRTGSLDEAIRHMRQAETAIANGAPIRQVREFQRMAVVALKKTQTEIGADVITKVDWDATAPALEDDQLAGARDEAPANYRELVSEYFKTLSASP